MEERRRNEMIMGERLATLEANFISHTSQMAEVIKEARRTNNILDEIKTALAEKRGAEAASKFIWGAIVSILGFVGGLFGAIVKHW